MCSSGQRKPVNHRSGTEYPRRGWPRWCLWELAYQVEGWRCIEKGPHKCAMRFSSTIDVEQACQKRCKHWTLSLMLSTILDTVSACRFSVMRRSDIKSWTQVMLRRAVCIISEGDHEVMLDGKEGWGWNWSSADACENMAEACWSCGLFLFA